MLNSFFFFLMLSWAEINCGVLANKTFIFEVVHKFRVFFKWEENQCSFCSGSL